MNITDLTTQAGIIYDRYLGTDLILPYTGFDSIKIQQNEVVTYSTINAAFEKLYKNYLYLYKSSRIASNIIPISAIAFAGVMQSTNNFTWYTASSSLSTSQFIPLSTVSNLQGLDNIKTIVVGKNNDLNYYAIFASTGTDLITLTSDSLFTNITMVLSSINTVQGSNATFKGITSLTINPTNNNLLVLDLSANLVHKYDLAGFLTYNTVLQNTLVYQGSIGGYGMFDDQLLFNSPNGIAVYNSNIYVLDSGNGCIKIYDKNLSWVSTQRLFRDLLTVRPLNLSIDSTGNIYVLTDSNYILKYNSTFTTKTKIDISSLAKTGDKFQQLVFSPTDSNIMYLISNNNVYKKLVNIPEDTIGKYLFYRFNVNTTETIKSFTSLATTGGDNNLIFSTASSTNAGKFSLYYDNLNLQDVIALHDFDVYEPDIIDINKDEYIQNWVFNKSLAKLIANHMRFRDQIIGKFLYTNDGYNNITFQGIRYLLPDEYASISFQQDLNNFIGSNEIFQNIIINRALEKIYNIQIALLNVLAAQSLSAPAITTPIYID
jgi:sugar lactone lactonase YvrE